ncbi:MAG: response regulator [Acidobacteria bacterium]|nr:response regulator [Acidobacteriota bacterium]
MIVDDNELDLEKVERGFRRLKITNPLVRAKDGLEALEVLRGSATVAKLARPYVILLDVNMPRMNGIEFLHELRADPTLADSTVVVLTTSDRIEDVEAAYENQVAGYIVKPLTRDDTLAALSKLGAYWNLSALPVGE